MNDCQRQERCQNARVNRHGWMIGCTLLIMVLVCRAVPSVAQQPAVATHVSTDAKQSADEVLARHVTFTVVDLPLDRALDNLSHVAKVLIEYQTPVIASYSKRVTISVTNTPLGTVLERILDGTSLQIVPGERGYLTVVAMPGGAADSVPQLGTIVGRVVDSATGLVLDAVTIKVASTKIAATTQDGGRFVLHNVPAGTQLLSVRAFGYRPADRAVVVTAGEQTTIRIALASVPTVLSGVVTTATGTQRKVEVGNDITTLNVDSIQQVAPITSVTGLLESRVPGLTVLHSSGVPGDPSRLRLRGPKSINGNNDPIVIIDGIRVYAAQSDPRNGNLGAAAVQAAASKNTMGIFHSNSYAAPSPLDQIDPNSIETIEVMKGPSASALYGSDAANGVIVITTKRGRSGPTRWSTTLGSDVSSLPGRWPLNIVRWGHDLNFPSQSCSIGNVVGCRFFDSVSTLQILNESRFSPFGTGHDADGSVTVSGGVPSLTYVLTGTAANKLGYLKLPDAVSDVFRQFNGYGPPQWVKRPDRYTTWGGNGALTAQPNPTLQFVFLSQLFHGTQRRSSLDNALPSFAGIFDTTAIGTGLYTAEFERATDEQLTTNTAMSVNWQPMRWLPLTSTVGLSTNTGRDETLLPRDILPEPDADSLENRGHYGVANKQVMMRTLNVGTNLPAWGSHVTTAVGFNVVNQSAKDFNAAVARLAVGVTSPLNLIDTGSVASQSATDATTFGWYLAPEFNVNSQLFITPGFRIDGGTSNGGRATVSGLPSKLNFASLFPRLAVSWVAIDNKNESPLLGVLSMLRPRLAIGSAGVQPGSSDRLRLLTTGVTTSNPGVLPSDALEVATLGNTTLRPERSSELEGGFEAELWQGRMTMNVTRARQMRHDAIISIPVAPSVVPFGASMEFKANVGEVRTTSTELSGTVTPIQTAFLSWTVSGNWAHTENVVVRLNQGQSPIDIPDGIGGVTRVVAGYPLFGRWALPIVDYRDIDQNGVISPNEIVLGDTTVYLGRQDPASIAALSTDLALFHGRVGVHANFSHQGSYTQINSASVNTGTYLSGANAPGAPLGEQAAYVAAVQNLTQYGNVQTIQTWQFNSFSLNYIVPAAVSSRLGGHTMIVALQGSNLRLWSNYRGKDPNVNAVPYGNAIADLGQLPQPRTWRLQLTLGN